MIRLLKKLDTFGAIFKDEITANKTVVSTPFATAHCAIHLHVVSTQEEIWIS